MLFVSGLPACDQPAKPVHVSVPVPATRYAVTEPDALPARRDYPLHRYGTYLQVDVDLNGQPAGRFLLDTGSAYNVVTPLVADQRRLPRGRRGAATGIAGVEAFTFRRAASLSIRDLSLDALDLAELDLYRFTAPLGRPMSGILGFCAFGSVPFTLDYAGPGLTLHRPASFEPRDGDQPHRYELRRGVPVVEATVGAGHTVWLIVDTGADVEITLPRACAENWPDIVAVPLTGRGRSRGIGGTVASSHTWLTTLRLFATDLKHVPVSFEQPLEPTRGGALPLGRVGGKLLQHFQLTFEPARKTLWTRWRPLDS